MTWPPPTRKDHEQFCKTEQWKVVLDACGRSGTHHVTYRLVLADGRVLRTRISHPVDRTDYGAGIWHHILRDQPQVTEAEFWSCVRDGVIPDRGHREPPAAALPAELVHLLITRVGLADNEVAGMSRVDALARLQRFWTEGT